MKVPISVIAAFAIAVAQLAELASAQTFTNLNFESRIPSTRFRLQMPFPVGKLLPAKPIRPWALRISVWGR